MSTNAAKPAGHCGRCGEPMYENIFHACTGSVALPVTATAPRPVDEALVPMTRASEDAADVALYEEFLRLNPTIARRVANQALELDAARAELERLREERDALTISFEEERRDARTWEEIASNRRQRIENILGQVRRLEDGLRGIREQCAGGHGDDLIAETADAVLAGATDERQDG